jgi:hypothetical protein
MTKVEIDLLRGYSAAMNYQPRDPYETPAYYEGYDQCAKQQQQKFLSREDLNKICHHIADVLDTREASKNA